MANYYIIGGDGQQYGPVTGEDVQQWIAEARLNGQSLAKAESDAEFRPLSTFPEFAGALTPSAPPGVSPPPLAAQKAGGRDAALQQVKSPAVALKVTGILNIIFGVWSLVKILFFAPTLQEINSQLKQIYLQFPQLHAQLQQLNDPQVQALIKKILYVFYGPPAIASTLFGLAFSLLIFWGATKMQSLRSYEFSITAAILAMLPCFTPCCILGLPVGVWALVVLRKPGVKSQFR